jgi:putative transposase
MVDTKNKLSIVKQWVIKIHRGGLYYKAKQESLENLKIMQLLDQQYFNTPFYGCRKLTFWLKDLGFKSQKGKTIDANHQLKPFIEPKTTMSKEHKKHLIYSKI